MLRAMAMLRTTMIKLTTAALLCATLAGCSLLKKRSQDDGDAGNITSLGAVATAELSQITFAKKDPVVGSTYNETQTVEMKMDITAPKKESAAFTEKQNEKVDILATDGKTINKVKVTYSEKTENDGKKTVTSPVSGKTYIAEFKDKKIHVTDADHKKVSAKEEKTVIGDFDDVLGKPDPLLTGMPGTSLKVGDKADALAEALRDLLSGEKSIELTDITVKLKEIAQGAGGKVGIFDVKVKASVPENPKLTLDLSGTLSARADDSRLLAILLSGPLTLAGGGVKAEGTAAITMNRTY